MNLEDESAQILVLTSFIILKMFGFSRGGGGGGGGGGAAIFAVSLRHSSCAEASAWRASASSAAIVATSCSACARRCAPPSDADSRALSSRGLESDPDCCASSG